MKKYILFGGVISASPILFMIAVNYLTASSVDIFYSLLVILSFPFMFFPSILPSFGKIGSGDVFGFIYFSDAITYCAYYFILGMMVGWVVYSIKKLKASKVS